MKKVLILVVCIVFCMSAVCLAKQTKIDDPTIEMLQGKWEGSFQTTLTKRPVTGEFTMHIKGQRAYVIRGAAGLSPMNSWTVRITKIEKGKIYMQSSTSEFELELFKNDKNEFILEGDYTGKMVGKPSANRTLTLTRTGTTVDDKIFPADDAKK